MANTWVVLKVRPGSIYGRGITKFGLALPSSKMGCRLSVLLTIGHASDAVAIPHFEPNIQEDAAGLDFKRALQILYCMRVKVIPLLLLSIIPIFLSSFLIIMNTRIPYDDDTYFSLSLENDMKIRDSSVHVLLHFFLVLFL